jgi:hypothetical protein
LVSSVELSLPDLVASNVPTNFEDLGETANEPTPATSEATIVAAVRTSPRPDKS